MGPKSEHVAHDFVGISVFLPLQRFAQAFVRITVFFFLPLLPFEILDSQDVPPSDAIDAPPQQAFPEQASSILPERVEVPAL